MKNLFSRFTLFLLFFFSLHSFAQPVSKSEFRQMFTQGNLMLLEKFYDTAAKVFLKLNTADPSNANINYKAGICYLNIPGQKRKAIPYLENALKQTSGDYREDEPTEKNAPEDALYYLGQAYHYAYRFDEAIVEFQKFRDIVAKWNVNIVKDVDHWIETSKNAKELYNKPVECTISNLGDSVNCEFADYSPVISADESMLVFTSRRLGTGGRENKTPNDEFLEDIWLCQRGPYGTWMKARGISKDINTENNEATIGLSADGQELYVYRDDGGGDGNIYISNLDGNYWNAPAKLDQGNINSRKWEPSACVSADGTTMYFVSDRPGGLGGRDIYQCKKLPDRSWGPAENLGPVINTPFDEDSPFIHPDGTTFFFSSTGHTSMGGFDVFYSTKVANGVWTKPINMGYPINTTEDDIYFVTSSDGRRAYYASFRPEGKGEKDIYMVSMPKAFVKSVAILVGYLKNRDGSPIPANSKITAQSAKGDIISNKPNEATGKFVQSLFPGQEYEITIEANGNKVFHDKFYLPEDSSYQSLGRGFFQRTIILGDTTNVFSEQKAAPKTIKQEEVPMDGQILLSQNTNDPAPEIAIQLLNTQGNIIASTTTDKNGMFKFQNIPADQRYMIKVDENDPILKTKNQFYLADNKGKIIQPSTQEGRFFLFKNLAADLNKAAPMEGSDATIGPPVAMTGKLAADTKGATPLADKNLILKDETGNPVPGVVTTDKSGNFTFNGLTSDKNYTIALEEKDKSKDLYLFNQKQALIRKAAKTGDFFVFKNLPTDLNKLGSMDVTDSVAPNPDINFDFVIYFPYNKKEIDISVNSFLSLTDKIVKTINANGKATIIIAASSSTVPTTKYASNEALAESRANEVKDQVRASISLKNIDESKFSYEITKKVQGPEYKNDAMQNRKEYEKWQFVKVIVK